MYIYHQIEVELLIFKFKKIFYVAIIMPSQLQINTFSLEKIQIMVDLYQTTKPVLLLHLHHVRNLSQIQIIL